MLSLELLNTIAEIAGIIVIAFLVAAYVCPRDRRENSHHEWTLRPGRWKK